MHPGRKKKEFEDPKQLATWCTNSHMTKWSYPIQNMSLFYLSEKMNSKKGRAKLGYLKGD